MDLKYLTLDLRAKLVRSGSAALSIAADNVCPVNNILNSLIGSLRIYLNNVLVNNNNQYYHYKSYIQTLYSFDELQKESFLESRGWYDDKYSQRKGCYIT